MCGIIGAIAERNIVNLLVNGLQRLEYRGYDSAGVAVLDADHHLRRIRCTGKVNALQAAVNDDQLDGTVGIAHTRWATHGKPCERNAHPHMAKDRIAVVHNGIIENHNCLRDELTHCGYRFQSDTDTEVIAHLVHRELQAGLSLLDAVKSSVPYLNGAYGAVLMDNADPNRIIVARSGSPLVIGIGNGENYIASDQLALLPVTRKFIYLEEGDIAEISRNSIRIFDHQGNKVERKIHVDNTQIDTAEKGHFPHFMLKEIYDQPQALNAAIDGRIDDMGAMPKIFGPGAEEIFERVENIQILACGTSCHAGAVARYWLESIAGIPCSIEIASEYRYREPVLQSNTLVITISQSGETADTLAALRYAKQSGAIASLTICNVSGSSLVRESDLAFMTRAGIEIGVASTKAFTTQLAGLATLTLTLAQKFATTSQQHAVIRECAKELLELPNVVEQTLMTAPHMANLAKDFLNAEHTLFLGRGTQFPIAQEGALKLKEISYIHAEAYAAGELKHGPLALIDDDMPVIVLAPNDNLSDKLKSNIEEVRARGGRLIVITSENSNFQSDETQRVVRIPGNSYWLAPIIYTLPLQLLSYYVALEKGTNIDQPRNLAKSVTVE